MKLNKINKIIIFVVISLLIITNLIILNKYSVIKDKFSDETTNWNNNNNWNTGPPPDWNTDEYVEPTVGTLNKCSEFVTSSECNDFYCKWDNNKCQNKECSEITDGMYCMSDKCSPDYVNNKFTKCLDKVCFEFDGQNCPKDRCELKKYDEYYNQCINKKCSKFDNKSKCPVLYCNWNNNKCQNKECSEITDDMTCASTDNCASEYNNGQFIKCRIKTCQDYNDDSDCPNDKCMWDRIEYLCKFKPTTTTQPTTITQPTTNNTQSTNNNKQPTSNNTQSETKITKAGVKIDIKCNEINNRSDCDYTNGKCISNIDNNGYFIGCRDVKCSDFGSNSSDVGEYYGLYPCPVDKCGWSEHSSSCKDLVKKTTTTTTTQPTITSTTTTTTKPITTTTTTTTTTTSPVIVEEEKEYESNISNSGYALYLSSFSGQGNIFLPSTEFHNL